MLIKSTRSAKVHLLIPSWKIAEGGWHAETPTKSLYSLEVPPRGHNISFNAKAVRETFMNYFINDGGNGNFADNCPNGEFKNRV